MDAMAKNMSPMSVIATKYLNRVFLIETADRTSSG